MKSNESIPSRHRSQLKLKRKLGKIQGNYWCPWCVLRQAQNERKRTLFCGVPILLRFSSYEGQACSDTCPPKLLAKDGAKVGVKWLRNYSAKKNENKLKKKKKEAREQRKKKEGKLFPSFARMRPTIQQGVSLDATA